MTKPSQTTQVRALRALQQEIHDCVQCPLLVKWCRTVAVEKRAAYKGEKYWGKPVSGFGDPTAQIVVLGLAPGAHGANRTGRVAESSGLLNRRTSFSSTGSNPVVSAIK